MRVIFRVIPALFAVFLTLVACGGRHEARVVPLTTSLSVSESLQSKQIDDDSVVDGAISQEIQGTERDRVHQAMKRHLPRFRHNRARIDAQHVSFVLYDFETQRFYANKKELHNVFEVGVPVPGTTNAYKLPNGRIRYTPRDQPPAKVAVQGGRSSRYAVREDHGTGPYRRLFTSDVSRFTTFDNFEQATIQAPCNAQPDHPKMNEGRDLGYIYMGEWGMDQTAGPEGGLLYNFNNIPSTDTYDTFFTVPNRGFVGTSQGGGYHYGQVAGAGHLGPFKWDCAALRDHGINMAWEFGGVLAANPPYNMSDHADFIVYTHDFRSGEDDVLAVSVPYDHTFGAWPPPSLSNGITNPCFGCVMKRMTSIGQRRPENLSNGSAFGPVKWSNASFNCDAPRAGCSSSGPPYTSPWSPPYIFACSEYPSWSNVQPDSYVPNGYQDCRNEIQGDKVQVVFTDFANEVVYISLDGSSLNTQAWPFQGGFQPPCSLDANGLCAVNSTVNMTTCFDYNGNESTVIGSQLWDVYSATGNAGHFASITYWDGGCSQATVVWQTDEPSVHFNDPFLP